MVRTTTNILKHDDQHTIKGKVKMHSTRHGPREPVATRTYVLMSGCNLVLGAQHRSGSSIKETSQLRRAVVERHVGPQVALCCFQSYAII